MDTQMFNRIMIDNNAKGTFGDGTLKGEIAVSGFKYPTL